MWPRSKQGACLDRQRRVFLQRAGMLLTLPLFGCEISSSPLRVASHVWPGYELMFLAARESWLAPSKVTLLDTPSPTVSMSWLQSGEVDAAALTLDETLQLCAHGVELEVVLVFNVSAGADMVIGKGKLTDLSQLPGKRVGVEDTALGALMLHEALNAAGLELEQIEVVPLQLDQQREAWELGRIDALVVFDPLASELLDNDAHLLFDSSQIPDTIVDVLAVRRDKLRSREKRAGVRELIRAHFQALAHLRSNPIDAGYRLAQRLGGSASAALASYQGITLPDEFLNHSLLAVPDGKLNQVASRLVEFMLANGLIGVRPTSTALANPIYLPHPTRSPGVGRATSSPFLRLFSV